jgi:hypothetical protein
MNRPIVIHHDAVVGKAFLNTELMHEGCIFLTLRTLKSVLF